MRRIFVTVWFMLAAAASNCAAACERVNTALTARTFPTAVDALRAMAERVLDESVTYDVEFAGALYSTPPHGVRVSVGRGCPGADSIEFAVPRIDGQSPIAYWHTHGRDGYARDRFSPDDAALVLREQRPFYLITPRGKIRVLEPDMAKRRHAFVASRRSVLRGPVGYAGRPVSEAS
jgi:hypothetical protein